MVWCNGGGREVFAFNTLETHTKYAHCVPDRTTLKDVKRFRNGSVCEPYERSLHERTSMGEPFIEKHALLTELSNINRGKHKRKSDRVCRRDREPSRTPIRSFKILRNLFMHVFFRVHPCHLHCTVMQMLKNY